MSVKEKLTDIADAVRRKTGKTSLLTLDGLRSSVDEVFEIGYTHGSNEGYEYGKENGIAQQYELLWDGMSAVLRERSAYSFGGRGWNNDTFRPPYPIVFYENAKFVLRNTRITGDIRELATIDFSKCTNMEYAFSGNHWLTAMGKIDASSCKTQNAAYYFGCDNRYLETVEEFVSTDVLSWDGIFSNCPMLNNIRVSGVIDSNKVNFKDSKNLSKGSITSILEACSDRVEEITFSRSNIKSAFGSIEDFNQWLRENERSRITVALV